MNSSPTFHLRLFGAPSIERKGADASRLTGRVAQRHRVALLALVAMAPGRRLSRDKLIAYLWPESDPERGRNLLKVSSYVVRTALGDSALVSEGDDLLLETDVVRVDAAEFEAALERADHAQAVALYRGPFLDGFFLSDAPEFEQWADGERARLAAGYAKALEALAEEAEARRDLATAAAHWRTRATLDPYYGWQCYLARDYDCAIEQYHRTIEISPTYGRGYERLGLAYAQKGALAEAIRALEKAIELDPERPDYIADLAYVQALRGEAAKALGTLQRAKGRPFEAFNIARAYVGLRQPDSAFAWLERSSWQWPHRAVRIDPALDPLRDDPRFAQLAARVDRDMGMR